MSDKSTLLVTVRLQSMQTDAVPQASGSHMHCELVRNVSSKSRRVLSSPQAVCAGLDVKPEADPQLCVALGAAIHAGVLAGLLSDTAELSDSTYQEHLHDRLSGS